MTENQVTQRVVATEEQSADNDNQEELSDALEMLGKGYEHPLEIHAPHTALVMGEDHQLEKVERGAWIKLSTNFRDVLKHLKGANLAVFLAIALGINADGESFPAFETIAEWTGYSRRAVATALKKLEEEGFLTVIRGQKKSNLYHVNVFAAFGEKSPTSAKNALVQKTTSDQCKKRHKNMSKIALKQDPINKNINKKQKSENEKTKAAVLRDPVWAMAAGEEYEPDPGLVALELIRQEWESYMRQSPNWALPGWDDFPAWLLGKKEQDQTVPKFARWFRADKFRKEGIGMWTPGGDKYGRFSFKSVWLQAFEDPKPVRQEQPKRREMTPFEMATQNVDTF